VLCLETLEGASQWEARAALLRSADTAFSSSYNARAKPFLQ